jgi:hypothetical protein
MSMLSVITSPIMLSVVMMNVVILSTRYLTCKNLANLRMFFRDKRSSLVHAASVTKKKRFKNISSRSRRSRSNSGPANQFQNTLSNRKARNSVCLSDKSGNSGKSNNVINNNNNNNNNNKGNKFHQPKRSRQILPKTLLQVSAS